MDAVDTVGVVASARQLGAYSSCVARYLTRLLEAAQDGPSYVRDQYGNVSTLIRIVSRIPLHESPDDQILVPLLIQMAEIAGGIAKRLLPDNQLQTAWVLLTQGGQIDDAFRALNDKRKLLMVHLAKQDHTLLGRIHVCLEKMAE